MRGNCDIDHLLFVLGMHRSGTSALAGALVRGGFTVPGTNLAGNDDNPDGYFEPRRLVDVDNEILSRLSSAWHDEGPLRPIETLAGRPSAVRWQRRQPTRHYA